MRTVPEGDPEVRPFLRHLQDPHHPGRVDRPDGEGAATNPACGDRMVLTLRVEANRILEARFQAEGCAATLAAGSATAGLIEGVLLVDVPSKASPEAIAAALGGLPPQRNHAALLASQAATRAAKAASTRSGSKFA
jgi:nitrogen fixation NifU-like protein